MSQVAWLLRYLHAMTVLGVDNGDGGDESLRQPYVRDDAKDVPGPLVVA